MTLDGKSIARCAKPKNFENVTSFVLHHLSPVKDTGYGQSSYVRLVKHMYQFQSVLLLTKSKVAPLHLF